MKNLLLVLFAVAAFAACKERKSDKVEVRPDYEGTHRASEKAHRSLGNETGGE